jgi:hypothetical protein
MTTELNSVAGLISHVIMAKIYRPSASATHTIAVECEVTSLNKAEEVKRKEENGGNSQ